MRALAYEAAASQYDRALEALGADDGRRRSELLVALGEATARAGDVAASRAAIDEAVLLARSGGDAPGLARAALARCGVAIVILDTDHELVALLEEAIALLGQQEAPLRAALLARLAIAIYYEDPDRRVRLAAEAAALARAADDRRVLAIALVAERIALWSPDLLDKRLATAGALVTLGVAEGDDEIELQGRHWRLVDLFEAGDRPAFDAELARYGAVADRTRLPQHRWYATFWRALCAGLAGDVATARRLSEEACAIGARADDGNAARVRGLLDYGIGLLQVGMPDGLPPGALDLLDRELKRPAVVANAYRCSLAWFFAAQGDLDRARTELAQAGPPEGIPRDVNWISSMAERAFALALTGGRRQTSESLANASLTRFIRCAGVGDESSRPRHVVVH